MASVLIKEHKLPNGELIVAQWDKHDGYVVLHLQPYTHPKYGKIHRQLTKRSYRSEKGALAGAKRMAAKEKRNPSAKPLKLKKGDPISIKPEFRDKGDENYLWFALSEVNPFNLKLDVTYRKKKGKPIFLPGRMIVQSYMVTKRKGKTLAQHDAAAVKKKG